MTRKEIEKLEPRALDLAVAKLMGWRYRWNFGGWINPLYVTLEPPDSTSGVLAPDPLPADAVFHGCPTYFSTDPVAASQVADRFSVSVIPSEDGYYAVVPQDIEHGNVHGTSYPTLTLVGKEGEEFVVATTAPRAICIAALLAVFATPAPAAGTKEGSA